MRSSFFLNAGIYSYPFSFRTAFGASHKFLHILFHFHSSQDLCFLYLWTSYFISCYFRSMLFNFHVFVNFPASLLLLTSVDQFGRAAGQSHWLAALLRDRCGLECRLLSPEHWLLCSLSIWSPVVESRRLSNELHEARTNQASREASHSAGGAENTARLLFFHWRTCKPGRPSWWGVVPAYSDVHAEYAPSAPPSTSLCSLCGPGGASASPLHFGMFIKMSRLEIVATCSSCDRDRTQEQPISFKDCLVMHGS